MIKKPLKEKHCNLSILFEEFRRNGIEIKKNADIYLYSMFDYLYNNGYLNEAEIVECNHRAINVLSKKNKSTDDFIELYKNSKVGKVRNFDWEAIEQAYENEKKQWEELLDDTSGILESVRDYGKSANNNL